MKTLETEQEAKAGLIHLRVRELYQLFNSLDPSPFIERDLDDDAVAYIVSWAREIPADLAIRLRVELTDSKLAGDPQPVLEGAVRNYFEYKVQLTRNAFRQLMRRGRLSLVIGLAALFSATAISTALASAASGAVTRLTQEVILVGGWVAMWRPIEIFLYDWWPLLREQRDYERLRDMQVEVVVQPAA